MEDHYRVFGISHGRTAPVASHASRVCTDVKHFFAACQQQRHDAHLDLLTPQVVREYLANRLPQGNRPHTIARILSALKAFDRILRVEGLRSVLTLLEMGTPRPPQRWPHFLSLEAVDRLLRQPRSAMPRGLRDAAMLGVL
jgi:integrase/recombinase XerD